MILAFETSTPCASLALCSGGDLVCELSIETKNRHGEALAPALDFMMKSAGIAFADVEAYAAGIGPGSFTGLRTGLAFVKGLVLANPRPFSAVSSLAALAMDAAYFDGPVLPVIDARKGEVFTAVFRGNGQGGLSRQSDDMAILPEGLAELTKGRTLILGAGLKGHLEAIKRAVGERAVIGPETLWNPRACRVAFLAHSRLSQGLFDDPESLTPVYVRFSDAELTLGAKR